MRLFLLKLSTTLLAFLSLEWFTFYPACSIPISNELTNRYQAIVLGEMVKKKVKKVGNFYLTEYKLKTKKWLLKQSNVKEAKYLKIKILGAELPKRGIVIRVSSSPTYVPMKKDAIFFLENNKKRKKNTYTISRDGIISSKYLEEIQKITKAKES